MRQRLTLWWTRKRKDVHIRTSSRHYVCIIRAYAKVNSRNGDVELGGQPTSGSKRFGSVRFSRAAARSLKSSLQSSNALHRRLRRGGLLLDLGEHFPEAERFISRGGEDRGAVG